MILSHQYLEELQELPNIVCNSVILLFFHKIQTYFGMVLVLKPPMVLESLPFEKVDNLTIYV